MCRDVRTRILLWVSLVLVALNVGCGGGGLPQTTSNSQSLQSDNSTPQSMQAPLLGFVYAADGSEVRGINGIPGASTQGSALALPEGVAGMDFAPGQKSAIVKRTGGASVGVISFSSGGPGSLVPISGGISQPDIIAFNPNGGAVALYSASEGQLQIVTGLPNKPQLTRNITSGELPDVPRTLAIADDGVTLLEGTVNSAVYLLAANGAQLIENVSDLGGMVFTPKSNNALIFDRNGGNLSLLQSVSSAHSTRVLASGLTGLEGTIALQSNGRRAVVASASANHLWEVDLQSLQAQDLQLSTTPTMLTPLRMAGDYLLSWQPGQLAWIVDTNQAKGTVYLVPAAAQAKSAQVR